MKPYVWKGAELSPDMEAERDRLQAEIDAHQHLLQKQHELAQIRARITSNITQETTAEHIRQTAFIRNGDSPATCKRRLDTAAREFGAWGDPRKSKETR